VGERENSLLPCSQVDPFAPEVVGLFLDIDGVTNLDFYLIGMSGEKSVF